MGVQVAVAGASGYAGGELIRLLAGHPEFDLATVTGHSQAGQRLAAVHPHLWDSDLVLQPTTPDALASADLAFLALPHGESAALAAQLPDTVSIVDLGADHRLRSAKAWTDYYGGEHAEAWTYGLPELPGQRELIRQSNRVANTGCYAVATILALEPLITEGLVDAEDVVVVASSGTSGAGKSLKPHLLASEVMGGLSTYKAGSHQHVPEIKQATGARTLSFVPVLAPMPRGILATVTARPRPSVTLDQVRAVFSQRYHWEPFVQLLPQGDWPRTAATAGANTALLQATVDKDSGRVLVVSAIDNLGKGAAGQAVQCANLMVGLPETTGLATKGVSP